jgi:Ca2+-binding EF-hand superfamily protein
MRLNGYISLAAFALCALVLRADGPPARPDLKNAKPLASCKLHDMSAKRPKPEMMADAVLYTPPKVVDPLANYERTQLGDWPMLAEAPRTDPWLRVVLLSRKRPVVIDLALLIDGKSFRDKRESWVEEIVAAAKQGPEPPKALPAVDNKMKADAAKKDSEGNKNPDAEGTKPTARASETASSKSDKDDKDTPKTDNKDKKKESDDTTKTAKNDAKEKDADKEKKDSDKKDKDKKKDEDKPKPYDGPLAGVESREAPTMRTRLANYLATNKTPVDPAEARWLIASWGAGPSVVFLDPGLSWQRVGNAPLETYLDKDNDGGFSREEIAQAEMSLKKTDVDSNDVVDINEIRRVEEHVPYTPPMSGYPLVVVLDANTNWAALDGTMAKLYGARAKDARSLATRAADVTLEVRFGEHDVKAAGISVLSVGPDLSASTSAVSATSDVITLDVDGDYVEFLGGTSGVLAEAEAAGSQIAIGAVLDGNPLLRLIDRDNNGRLTRRQRQDLSALFASLDRDHDGSVSNAEVPIPIRFALTLGPHVHELLASPAPAARAMTTRPAAPTAPSWFTSMDKNNDGDLSRSEFLGTAEQFNALDTNGDGLISVAEALKLKTEK